MIFKFVKALLSGFRQGRVEGELSQVPAHFLIHEDGKIHTAYYGKNIADQISWESVFAFLEEPRREPPKKDKQK